MKDKYAGKTTPSLLRLKRDLMKCSLKDGKDDPDVWITKLEDYRARINEIVTDAADKMTDKEMMLHILNNVPKDYDIEVSKFEDKLENGTLTLETIRSGFNLRFEKNNEDAGEKEEEETALGAFAKQFKGKCWKCGTYGHKGADCKKSGKGNNNGKGNNGSNNNGGGRFSGQCHYCKKPGHKIADC